LLTPDVIAPANMLRSDEKFKVCHISSVAVMTYWNMQNRSLGAR
jgi:hypothetical protein